MTVRSISKAIAIMRYLAASDAPQGVNCISRQLGMAPSSCFNILKTLSQESLIIFDQRTKSYSIDGEFIPIFSPRQDMTSWLEGIRAQLVDVARRHILSCGLWEVGRSRVILREVFDSPDPTRVYLAIGQRLPSHIGAMGRCIAAHEALSRAEVAEVVAQLRWQSPPSAKSFWQDMEQVLVEGWAIDRSNYIRGLTTIAAPICDPKGRVLFCVTGTSFDGQHDASQLKAAGAQLSSIATEAGDARAKLLAG